MCLNLLAHSMDIKPSHSTQSLGLILASDINFDGTIIKIRHLSFQSINQIEKDKHGTNLVKGQKGNTERRLEVVAQEILTQLDKI